MYFNLDRQKKQRILDYYRKEANELRKRKQEVKKQQIQEEKNFLHQKEQRQQESDQKLSQENYRKRKALMDEYLEMIQKTKDYLPGYHFKPKNKEVIINNWGKTKEESLKENRNIFTTISSNKYKEEKERDFNTLNPEEKVKRLIKPVDCMNKFLTDEQNEKEVKSFFLKQRQNKRIFYKNLLYSQYENSAQKNKKIYGTDDILILKEKKKKNITENPYRERNIYSFGDSNLKNNPILNPENNMRYNKYFQDFYPETSNENMENTNNNNKCNNINIDINDYSNNYIKERIYNNKRNNSLKKNFVIQEESNFAINGSNIMNNYEKGISRNYNINNNFNNNNINRSISKYSFKKNGLTRNFSEVYQGCNANKYNGQISNYNNFGYKHKFLNNSNRSMSQIKM